MQGVGPVLAQTFSEIDELGTHLTLLSGSPHTSSQWPVEGKGPCLSRAATILHPLAGLIGLQDYQAPHWHTRVRERSVLIENI
jgi:hypothetical protein